MGTADRLRTDDVDGGGTPAPLVAGKSRAVEVTRANYGAGDVRFSPRDRTVFGVTWFGQTTVLRLAPFAAGDSFKLGVYAQGVDGDFARTDTVAFVHGTNATAAAIQSELRTATGDSSLTVTGTTDTGPFTVQHFSTVPEIVAHTLVSGCSVQVSRGLMVYDDRPVASATHPNGTPFDQESSKGFGATVPLGYGTDTDGAGQARGTELLPPNFVSVAGGSGQVVIDATEETSGGTNAVVLYAIRKLEQASGSWATQYVTVDSEDADGDVTISSLTAGDYVLLAHTQTASGRVSRPAAPVYFSVA